MIERKLWRTFDYTLLLTVLLISLVSLLSIRSATLNNLTGNPLYFVQKQVLWVGIGLVAMFITVLTDYLYFYRMAHYFYYFNIALLTAVLFIGREGGGAQRWLDLKVFDLQPSELAKLAIIVILAKVLSERKEPFESIYDLVVPFFYVLLPVFLIFLQPDLGTSLVLFAVLFTMLFMAGVFVKHLLLILTVGIGVGFPLLWLMLKDYQKMRLLVFINPEVAPMSYGYQLLQSMIAIGAGGFAGYFSRTGELFQGTQSGLNFLPAQHTDFIFSVLGEEFGFVGALFLMMLFFILIYRIIRIARLSKDTFGSFLCGGVAAMFMFQIFVNIGMTIGIMPVTGLPLPLMSYGGSAYLLNIMSIGLVLNVGMRRYKILF